MSHRCKNCMRYFATSQGLASHARAHKRALKPNYETIARGKEVLRRLKE